jgi:hypothetical protein
MAQLSTAFAGLLAVPVNHQGESVYQRSSGSIDGSTIGDFRGGIRVNPA